MARGKYRRRRANNASHTITNAEDKYAGRVDIGGKNTQQGRFMNAYPMNSDSMRKGSSGSASLNNASRENYKDMDNQPSETEEKGNGTGISRLSAIKEKIIRVVKKVYRKLENAANSYISISAGNLLFPVLFFIGTVIYLEVIVHLFLYHRIDLKIIYPVLFALPFGMLSAFLTGLFKPVVNKILLWIITCIICFIFGLQVVYYYVFKVYFSFQSLGMAGDAVSEFSSDVMTAVRANIFKLFLIFLPVLLLAFLVSKWIDYSRRCLKLQGILLGAAAVFHMAALVTLLLFGKSDYSPYDLYHKSNVQDLCGKELGITTMTRIDIRNLIRGKNSLVLADTMALQPETDSVPTAVPSASPAAPSKAEQTQKTDITPTSAPVTADTSANIMNIDFAALAKKEKNKTFRSLDSYFASAVPTNKNAYTGMFKGYNLILITAEGFSPYAVRQDKTPTLYQLTHEGFVFNNFYTALWQTSTSDGEYVALTGLIPAGTRSMYKGRKNLWPFTIGNQFDLLGVQSKAYHDHTYTYYQRNETHPNLGYIFKAKGNGLKLEHPNIWPESDLEMVNSTVDEYINEEQFHVYYLTVSGHMNYSFSGNMMSYKNKALVEDLPYSDDVKAYIASQIELDRALKQLISRLEAAGAADRTVIALSADHYPYAWSRSIINEAAGHTVEPNFDMYRNHFILWCKGMKNNIIIDKPCSSLDILPTLSNLFGLEYDSRLLMGQDILSDSAPLVILANRSFITDKVKYNAETGEITKLTADELPKGYISNINGIIKNKFSVSESILENDYYRHILK